MEIEIEAGKDIIEIEDGPQKVAIELSGPGLKDLTPAQRAAVERVIVEAINKLDLREIISDSVADTCAGMKRRLRDKDKVHHE